jgi:hypothetical protein
MTTRSRSERAKLAYTLKSPQRKEFFRVWDARPQGQLMKEFCTIHKNEQWCPSRAHGYRWLKEREKIIKEGLGSPTRRLPPQKPQGRAMKDTSTALAAIDEAPHLKSIKRFIAESGGVSRATLYRRLKARREEPHHQTTPVRPLDTVPSSGDISAEWQDGSSRPGAYSATAQTIVDPASSITDRNALSMASNQDISGTTSDPGSVSHRRQATKRREQTSVACSACRNRKTKVSASRVAQTDVLQRRSHD